MDQTNALFPPPSEEDLHWLKSLQDQVSERILMRDRFHNFHTRQLVRKLTMDEFERLRELAPQFMIVPSTAEYGFNFGITLCIEPQPIYPGVEPTIESVFFISGEYLPDEIGQRFENAWEVLSLLSHNNVNREKLARNSIEKPRDKSHYDY